MLVIILCLSHVPSWVLAGEAELPEEHPVITAPVDIVSPGALVPEFVLPASEDWANRVSVSFSGPGQNYIGYANPIYNGIVFDPSIWSPGNAMGTAQLHQGEYAYQAGLAEQRDPGRHYDMLWLRFNAAFLANVHSTDVDVTIRYWDGPNESTGHWDGHAFMVSWRADAGGPQNPGYGSAPNSISLTGTNMWQEHTVRIPAGQLFSSTAASGHFMNFWGITIHVVQPVWISSIVVEKVGGGTGNNGYDGVLTGHGQEVSATFQYGFVGGDGDGFANVGGQGQDGWDGLWVAPRFWSPYRIAGGPQHQEQFNPIVDGIPAFLAGLERDFRDPGSQRYAIIMTQGVDAFRTGVRGSFTQLMDVTVVYHPRAGITPEIDVVINGDTFIYGITAHTLAMTDEPGWAVSYVTFDFSETAVDFSSNWGYNTDISLLVYEEIYIHSIILSRVTTALPPGSTAARIELELDADPLELARGRLQQLVNQISLESLDNEDFEPGSWAIFNQALIVATQLLDEAPGVNQDPQIYDAAREALQAARNALVPVGGESASVSVTFNEHGQVDDGLHLTWQTYTPLTYEEKEGNWTLRTNTYGGNNVHGDGVELVLNITDSNFTANTPMDFYLVVEYWVDNPGGTFWTAYVGGGWQSWPVHPVGQWATSVMPITNFQSGLVLQTLNEPVYIRSVTLTAELPEDAPEYVRVSFNENSQNNSSHVNEGLVIQWHGGGMNNHPPYPAITQVGAYWTFETTTNNGGWVAEGFHMNLNITDTLFDSALPMDVWLIVDYWVEGEGGYFHSNFVGGAWDSEPMGEAWEWNTFTRHLENFSGGLVLQTQYVPVNIRSITLSTVPPAESARERSDWSEEVTLYFNRNFVNIPFESQPANSFYDGIAFIRADGTNVAAAGLGPRTPGIFGSYQGYDVYICPMASPEAIMLMYFDEAFTRRTPTADVRVYVEFWDDGIPGSTGWVITSRGWHEGNWWPTPGSPNTPSPITVTGNGGWRWEYVDISGIPIRGHWLDSDIALNTWGGLVVRDIRVVRGDVPDGVYMHPGFAFQPSRYLYENRQNMFFSGEAVHLPVDVVNLTRYPAEVQISVSLWDYNNVLRHSSSSATVTVPVTEVGASAVTITPVIPGSLRRGSYHLEYSLVVNGSTVATERHFFTMLAELSPTQSAIDGVASPIDINAWGVASHFLWYGDDNPANDESMMTAIRAMQAAGITTVRDEYTWFQVERQNMNQEYTFNHSRWISLMVQNGITPIIVFNYGHDLWGWDPAGGQTHGGAPHEIGGQGWRFEEFPRTHNPAGIPLPHPDNPFLPHSPNAVGKTYLDALGDYVYALVRHFNDPGQPYYAYTSQLYQFEIWNEPNLVVSAAVFFPVLQMIHNRAHEAWNNYHNGGLDLYLIGTATCMLDQSFIRGLMRLGGWRYMDAFSWHYPEYPERHRYLADSVLIQEWILYYSSHPVYGDPIRYPSGKFMPIWITEMGGSSFRHPDYELAAFYAQYFIEHRAYWCDDYTIHEAIHMYVLQNYTHVDQGWHQVQLHGITYLEGPYAPKPMVVSMNAAAWLLRYTQQGQRFDDMFLLPADSNDANYGFRRAAHARIHSNPNHNYALKEGVRVYTFYGTQQNQADPNSPLNVGDQVIALYTVDWVVPVSIYVGQNFRLFDGFGNAVHATTVGGMLSLELTVMPYYIVIPAANALTNISLDGGLFNIEPGIRSIAAGNILEIEVTRTSAAQNMSGYFRATMREGWSLVSASGNPVSQLAFGPGTSDIVRVLLPDETAYGRADILLNAENAAGDVFAGMTIQTNVLRPIMVETFPERRPDGDWGVAVRITNNRLAALPAGTVNITVPASVGALGFPAIPPGQSYTVGFADPRLNPDTLMPVVGTVEIYDAATGFSLTETIDRASGLSALGTVRAEGVSHHFQGGGGRFLDWYSIPWEEAYTFYPDYENWSNMIDYPRTPPRPGGWGGKDDLWFVGRTMFDDDFLFIRVEVTDDYHVLSGDINNSWAQDSLQVTIDPMRGPGTARDAAGNHGQNGFNGEISIIAAMFPGAGHFGMAINHSSVPGLTMRNLRYSLIRIQRFEETNITLYELALAWEDILAEEQLIGGFDPATTHLGFSITVNDSDTADDRAWLSYMHGRALGINMLRMGDLVLLEGSEDTGVECREDLGAALTHVRGLNHGDFTRLSWALLHQVYVQAAALYNNEHATAQELENMTTRLWDAIDALILIAPPPPEADKAPLIAAIATAETFVVSEFTRLNWVLLQDALNHARLIVNNEHAIQEQVDAALNRLSAAKANRIT